MNFLKENLMKINSASFEIISYFIKSIIYDGSYDQIKVILELYESSLNSYKDRRTPNSFLRFFPNIRYRRERREFLLSNEIIDNFKNFFRLRTNLNPQKYEEFKSIFYKLDDKMEYFSKILSQFFIQSFNIEQKKEDSKNNLKKERENIDLQLEKQLILRDLFFKACVYWYINSLIIPKFSKLKFENLINNGDFKKMLNYAFILLFRIYEQTNLDFTDLNSMDLDLEIDYLIQDVNNIKRFMGKMK